VYTVNPLEVTCKGAAPQTYMPAISERGAQSPEEIKAEITRLKGLLPVSERKRNKEFAK
jgi:hypothetical protein